MDGLAKLFEPDGKWEDDATTVSELGSESADAVEERTRARAEESVLKDVIATCRKYARHARGMCSFVPGWTSTGCSVRGLAAIADNL